MPSCAIVKPRARAQPISRRRAAMSSSDSACRLTPLSGIAPSLAISMWRCHKRASLTRSAASVGREMVPVIRSVPLFIVVGPIPVS